jgi:type I restriction enzyme R subunit
MALKAVKHKALQKQYLLKEIRLIHHLQHSAFMDEEYQKLRNSLIETVLAQINALNTELISSKIAVTVCGEV